MAEIKDDRPPFMWQQKLEEAQQQNAKLQQDLESLTKRLADAINANHSFAKIHEIVQKYFKKAQVSNEDFDKFLLDIDALQRRLDAKFSYVVLRTDVNSSRLDRLETLLNEGYEIYSVREAQDFLEGQAYTVNDYVLRKRVEE